MRDDGCLRLSQLLDVVAALRASLTTFLTSKPIPRTCDCLFERTLLISGFDTVSGAYLSDTTATVMQFYAGAAVGT